MEENKTSEELTASAQTAEAAESSEPVVTERPDYEQELVSIIRTTSSPKLLKERISDYHENDIAAALSLLTQEERQKIYRILDADVLADIFEYLDDVAPYLKELTIRKKVEILTGMDTDKAVDFLRQTSKEERSILLDLIDDESKRDIAMIESFDEDEIGSRMSTNYIEIHTGLTIRQAMDELVRQAAENDNISTLYVTDDSRTFYGAISLPDLIRARQNEDLDDLIVTSYPYVYGTESVDDCIERIKDYSEDSIPVLDDANKLLGVITSQDLIEVVDDELGEDYARLAGLSAEEDLNEPVKESMRKRVPWLCVLLVLGMVVSSVVGLFEEVVASLTIVVLFQSLILDMAGNVGTQSLAVTIRVLSNEDLDRKKRRRLVWKEGKVALINGLLIGLASFAVTGIYIMLIKGHPAWYAFSVSGVIALALVIAMFISGLAGAAIPLLFKKLGIDPAVASGPLITTLNDLVAVVTYYSLVWILLLQVLHLQG